MGVCREIVAKQIGVAKLRVKMNEAKEELGKAVAGQVMLLKLLLLVLPPLICSHSFFPQS